MKSNRGNTAGLLILLLTAAAGIRLAALVVERDHLSRDIDAYRKLAEGLADGRGYSVPGGTRPTAFRPPLYPLLLAAVFRFGGGNVAIGLVHLVLSTATVVLTYCVGQRLGLGRGSLIAAALVAVDPLLVQYTTVPMTETLFTFLVALLLFLLVRRDDAPNEGIPTSIATGDWGPRSYRLFVGVVFALGALCRPAIWAFGGLVVGWWILQRWKPSRQQRRRIPWEVALGTAVVVGPWLVRNMLVLDRPIFTTTHGGYTLLLGNNPVFYREVVDRPWGTVWDRGSLAKWNRSLEAAMRQENPPVESESARDRWMTRRAISNIRAQPAEFLRACQLRMLRFWNVAPLGPATDAIRSVWLRFCRLTGQENWKTYRDDAVTIVRWGLSLFYAAITIGLLLSLLRMNRTEWRCFSPLLLLIVSLCVVHLFYWANTRMRAPLIPAIALLAVRGFLFNRKRTSDPATGMNRST